MALGYIQQKKRQKYLVIVFLIVIVVTLFVVWQGFFREESDLSSIAIPPPRPAQIPFELLEGEALKSLLLFEEIPSLPKEELGRENPFVPF